jgi:hypothetical protein
MCAFDIGYSIGERKRPVHGPERFTLGRNIPIKARRSIGRVSGAGL